MSAAVKFISRANSRNASDDDHIKFSAVKFGSPFTYHDPVASRTSAGGKSSSFNMNLAAFSTEGSVRKHSCTSEI